MNFSLRILFFFIFQLNIKFTVFDNINTFLHIILFSFQTSRIRLVTTNLRCTPTIRPVFPGHPVPVQVDALIRAFDVPDLLIPGALYNKRFSPLHHYR